MIGAIIQARTSSSRLPKKVLKELPFGSGITALEQVIRRTKQSKAINQIIVATTIDENDVSIVKIAQQEDVKWYRGSVENVLERYYLAAKDFSIDHIVRITSDCPCINPGIIDLVIDRHFSEQADYTSNALIRSYPDGMDVEIFSFDSLEKAYRNAQKEYEKEHVTVYIQNAPDLFKIINVVASQELNAPERRITLDTWQDYVLLCYVFDQMYDQDPFFNAVDIMDLFNQKSWLDSINQIRKENIVEILGEEQKELMEIACLEDCQKRQSRLEKYFLEKAR